MSCINFEFRRVHVVRRDVHTAVDCVHTFDADASRQRTGRKVVLTFPRESGSLLTKKKRCWSVKSRSRTERQK